MIASNTQLLIQPQDTEAVPMLVSHSSDPATIMIGLAALICSILGLALGLLYFLRSGPRVNAIMTLRWMQDNGRSRPLAEGFDPTMSRMYDASKPAEQGWVVAVEVRNMGRSPTTITSWYLEAIGALPVQRNDIRGNPDVPVYLRPGEVKAFMDEADRFFLNEEQMSQEISARVTVVKGRKYKEVCPKQPLRVGRPRMTQRDLLQLMGL